MCITLSGHAGVCDCAKLLQDKTLVRLCDSALINERTPCNLVSFSPPSQSSTDLVCLRCSRVGHMAIFVDPTSTRTPSAGGQDQYDFKDIYAELETQLLMALETSIPFDPRPAPADDYVMVEPSKDEPGFVMIEHEDAEEQFSEEGAPLLGRKSDRNLDVFLGHPPSMLKQGTALGLAIGRFFYSR
jgi:hypothetical protein